MRLITRADLDGLTSAILLQEVEAIDEIEFAHPKDVQDGKVAVTDHDILANLPYDERAGLWFDHHVSQSDAAWNPEMRGNFEIAPSAARVIADHYKSDRFDRFADLLDATDRLDAALLTRDDIVDPKGWILVGYTLDPRSGLGAFKEYFRHLMSLAKAQTVDQILQDPQVRKQVDRLKAEEPAFLEHLKETSRQDGNVVITDVRGRKNLPSGNRFLIYDLFPSANVSARVADGRNNEFVSIQVGHNILKRDCKTSIGDMMAQYGGGGHTGAGTCQPAPGDADRVLGEIVTILKNNG
ncbi:MAG TPA: exopolyphosphatase [Candidatus Baltobacteraceae bacterium]|nr:exopolyphosphatase [Candidatus Baltobacteraceae bacterium]